MKITKIIRRKKMNEVSILLKVTCHVEVTMDRDELSKLAVKEGEVLGRLRPNFDFNAENLLVAAACENSYIATEDVIDIEVIDTRTETIPI